MGGVAVDNPIDLGACLRKNFKTLESFRLPMSNLLP